MLHPERLRAAAKRWKKRHVRGPLAENPSLLVLGNPPRGDELLRDLERRAEAGESGLAARLHEERRRRGICTWCGGKGWAEITGDPYDGAIQRCDSCAILPDDDAAEAAARSAGWRPRSENPPRGDELLRDLERRALAGDEDAWWEFMRERERRGMGLVVLRDQRYAPGADTGVRWTHPSRDTRGDRCDVYLATPTWGVAAVSVAHYVGDDRGPDTYFAMWARRSPGSDAWYAADGPGGSVGQVWPRLGTDGTDYLVREQAAHEVRNFVGARLAEHGGEACACCGGPDCGGECQDCGSARCPVHVTCAECCMRSGSGGRSHHLGCCRAENPPRGDELLRDLERRAMAGDEGAWKEFMRERLRRGLGLVVLKGQDYLPPWNNVRKADLYLVRPGLAAAVVDAVFDEGQRPIGHFYYAAWAQLSAGGVWTEASQGLIYPANGADADDARPRERAEQAARHALDLELVDLDLAENPPRGDEQLRELERQIQSGDESAKARLLEELKRRGAENGDEAAWWGYMLTRRRLGLGLPTVDVAANDNGPTPGWKAPLSKKRLSPRVGDGVQGRWDATILLVTPQRGVAAIKWPTGSKKWAVGYLWRDSTMSGTWNLWSVPVGALSHKGAMRVAEGRAWECVDFALCRAGLLLEADACDAASPNVRAFMRQSPQFPDAAAVGAWRALDRAAQEDQRIDRTNPPTLKDLQREWDELMEEGTPPMVAVQILRRSLRPPKAYEKDPESSERRQAEIRGWLERQSAEARAREERPHQEKLSNPESGDERLRRLERQAAAGDEEAKLRLEAERARRTAPIREPFSALPLGAIFRFATEVDGVPDERRPLPGPWRKTSTDEYTYVGTARYQDFARYDVAADGPPEDPECVWEPGMNEAHLANRRATEWRKGRRTTFKKIPIGGLFEFASRYDGILTGLGVTLSDTGPFGPWKKVGPRSYERSGEEPVRHPRTGRTKRSVGTVKVKVYPVQGPEWAETPLGENPPRGDDKIRELERQAGNMSKPYATPGGQETGARGSDREASRLLNAELLRAGREAKPFSVTEYVGGWHAGGNTHWIYLLPSFDVHFSRLFVGAMAFGASDGSGLVNSVFWATRENGSIVEPRAYAPGSEAAGVYVTGSAGSQISFTDAALEHGMLQAALVKLNALDNEGRDWSIHADNPPDPERVQHYVAQGLSGPEASAAAERELARNPPRGDEKLRSLEREWEATRDPLIAEQLAAELERASRQDDADAARVRAGLVVSFPVRNAEATTATPTWLREAGGLGFVVEFQLAGESDERDSMRGRRDEILVTVRDPRFTGSSFGPVGQKVGSWYGQTLLESGPYGLDMQGDVAAWKLDAGAFRGVRRRLQALAERGVGRRSRAPRVILDLPEADNPSLLVLGNPGGDERLRELERRLARDLDHATFAELVRERRRRGLGAPALTDQPWRPMRPGDAETADLFLVAPRTGIAVFQTGAGGYWTACWAILGPGGTWREVSGSPGRAGGHVVGLHANKVWAREAAAEGAAAALAEEIPDDQERAENPGGDERLRELERAAASGDMQAAARLREEQQRRGIVPTIRAPLSVTVRGKRHLHEAEILLRSATKGVAIFQTGCFGADLAAHWLAWPCRKGRTGKWATRGMPSSRPTREEALAEAKRIVGVTLENPRRKGKKKGMLSRLKGLWRSMVGGGASSRPDPADPADLDVNEKARGFVGTASLEDVAQRMGPKKFKKAMARFKKFHGYEPTAATVWQYPSSTDEEKIVVALGHVPETHYETSWKSNKDGYHWVHKHKKGNEPLEVLDPETGVTSKIGGEFKVTDWWREASEKE